MRAPASMARTIGREVDRLEGRVVDRRSRPGRWNTRWSSTSPRPCRRRRRSAWPCRARRSGASRSWTLQPAEERRRRESADRTGSSWKPSYVAAPAHVLRDGHDRDRSPSGYPSPAARSAVAGTDPLDESGVDARPRARSGAGRSSRRRRCCGRGPRRRRTGSGSRGGSSGRPAWKPSTMRRQPAASFWSGRTAAAAQHRAQKLARPRRPGPPSPCSSWVIWPIFSSTVISASRAVGSRLGRLARIVPVDRARGRGREASRNVASADSVRRGEPQPPRPPSRRGRTARADVGAKVAHRRRGDGVTVRDDGIVGPGGPSG